MAGSASLELTARESAADLMCVECAGRKQSLSLAVRILCETGQGQLCRAIAVATGVSAPDEMSKLFLFTAIEILALVPSSRSRDENVALLIAKTSVS